MLNYLSGGNFVEIKRYFGINRGINKVALKFGTYAVFKRRGM